jgi:enoyl-[acyl-carrier protein] reductase/trans-2-enoyl-CoA reductase (NAD+)
MKESGTHEGPIEQMVRLFGDHIGPGRRERVDEEGRIRLDDVEMRQGIQAEVMARWSRVSTANLRQISDYDGFQRYFHQLFGFDVPGVDYSTPVEIEVPLEAEAA